MVQARIKLYKLLLLGNRDVGKTALSLKFTVGHCDAPYTLELDDCYRKQFALDDITCVAEMLPARWSVGEYVNLRKQYILDSEAIMLVYSVASRSSFEALGQIHEMIKTVKGETLTRTPIMVLGNMADQGKSDGEREVSTAEGAALAEDIGAIGFFETSAKDDINIEEAVHDTIRSLRRTQEEEEKEQKRRAGERSLGRRLSRFIARLKS